MHRILRALDDSFSLAPGCEVTCEMDPATFDAAKARSFRTAGVTRASIGAQAFDNELLRACGRGHSVQDIYDAVAVLRAAGYDNVSVDLISGLPGQTIESWRASLRALVALAPEHASTYDLSVDPGTRFGKLYTPGVAPLPSEDAAADMMAMTAEVLGVAGWEHYEISNYAREKGLESRHNLAYWDGVPFFAAGLGATSLVPAPDGRGQVRYARSASMTGYTEYVRGLENYITGSRHISTTCVGGTDCMPDVERWTRALYPGGNASTADELLEDALMNGFRRVITGVDVGRLACKFGDKTAARVVDTCRESGFVELGMMTINDRTLRLTEKGGMFENTVVSAILHKAIWLHQPKSDGAAHAIKALPKQLYNVHL
jgi:coproporphyrinogen III oxidase-like Fe-S oxidoreductase